MVLENIGGDEEFLRQLLEMFLARADEMVRTIDEAVMSGQALRLEQSAHLLKGTAGNLCARRVALYANQLEALGRAGHLPEAQELVEPLRHSMTLLTDAVRRYLSKPESKAA
jgi:HPt (histidine-containing phosphotransfer) domain-containing protein